MSEKMKLSSQVKVAITFDVDWAPDYMISYVSDLLIAHGIPSTWFITHHSHAIEQLKRHSDLFELGIHPNFMENSSHGGSVKAVINHCLGLVPAPRTMRTHGYFQSWNILETIAEMTGIEVDCSIYTPRANNAKYFEYFFSSGRKMLRIPTVWEDSLEPLRSDMNFGGEVLENFSGLAVLNFHPVHLFLNTVDPTRYAQFKNSDRSLENALSVVNTTQSGPLNLFRALMNSSNIFFSHL